MATGICGCELPELAAMDVCEYRIPLKRSISPLEDIKATFMIYQLCRKNRYDIVHTHTLKASLVGQLAAGLARIPVRIETAHGTIYMSSSGLLKRFCVVMLEKLAARKAHRVWVLNTEDYELFKRRKIGAPHAVELLGKGGIGLDIDCYTPCALGDEHIQEYRHSIGVPPGVLLAGFVGRLVSDKGVNELIQAWQNLSERIPSAWLLIVSAVLPSERQSELVSAGTIKQLKNCVLLTNRSDMNKLYRCMDMLVLPSYREGFSRAIMEAMASGIPVVATDVKGCRDAVIDGQTGLLVPCGDVDSLTKAMCRLINDAPLRKTLSVNARQWAVNHFDQRTINTRIRQTYEYFLKTAGDFDNEQ